MEDYGKHLLALKVGGGGLGVMDFVHRTGEHVLVDEQEVGILASLDAAALVLDEHLLGNVDGHSVDGLLAGDEFFCPIGSTIFSRGRNTTSWDKTYPLCLQE